jgi:hypothetical protein
MAETRSKTPAHLIRSRPSSSDPLRSRSLGRTRRRNLLLRLADQLVDLLRISQPHASRKTVGKLASQFQRLKMI